MAPAVRTGSPARAQIHPGQDGERVLLFPWILKDKRSVLIVLEAARSKRFACGTENTQKQKVITTPPPNGTGSYKSRTMMNPLLPLSSSWNTVITHRVRNLSLESQTRAKRTDGDLRMNKHKKQQLKRAEHVTLVVDSS